MKNWLALKLQPLKLLMSVAVPVCAIISCLLLVVNNTSSASEPLKPLQPFEERELQPSSVPVLSFPDGIGTLTPKTPPPKTLLKAEEQTVRGQVAPTMNEIDEILNSPVPHVQGAVDRTAIEPKLVEQTSLGVPPLTLESSAPLLPSAAGAVSSVTPPVTAAPAAVSQPANQFAYGTLLLATAVTTIGLIYMAFVAYDYRQRWMQTLLMQNDRFSLGSFDGDFDDVYGTPHYV